MARRPEFDRSAVVQRAMAVFWQHGFHGASLAVLGTAMGLQPGSIYAAFGSKEQLFREALAAYVAWGRSRAEQIHQPRGLLEAWFEQMIRAALEEGSPGRGCLLLHSAASGSLDATTSAMVAEELNNLERLFRLCVVRVRKTAPRQDAPGATDTARLLVATLAGISALSRAGASKSTLESAARAALATV